VAPALADPHLTRILLDRRTPAGREDVRDATALHRLAMRLVDEDLGTTPRHAGGVLFRLDDGAVAATLLVQTLHAPRLDRLADRGHRHETRPLSPLLERLVPGTRLVYRLVAAPSKRVARTGHVGGDPADPVDQHPDRAGKVVPLSGADADAWWSRRAAEAGLDALAVRETVVVGDARATSGSGHRIRHQLRRFDGTATAADPGLLRAALLTGIGRGKAYGAGMLSVAVIR
jgi:CRISPR system Cascade subunit CasE